MLANNAKNAKEDPYGYFALGLTEYSDSIAWSLLNYRDSFDSAAQIEKREAWDELEKSIIANLADDVIVGVLGDKVDIVVKKKF